jgi:glycosyltransferase involved in cell wall biosynthesis
MTLLASGGHDRAVTRICVVTPYAPSHSETFIKAHVTNLPASVLLVHGWRPTVDDRAVLSLPERLMHKAWRTVSGADLERETTAAYCKIFRRHRAEAVLAEYGPTGVKVMHACRQLELPLVVHFHGFDASVRSVLDEYGPRYPEMFEQAARIIAVSRAMRRKLIAMGASPRKVSYNPCGVDCDDFTGAAPGTAPPVFVSVGRFVEKKAHSLTIEAFAHVQRVEPTARLRLIGDGPMFDHSRDVARRLGVDGSVDFLGQQPPAAVRQELRNARCFVQHSIQAANGDCEGTPVGILEAGATGLPVVATRHGGIPDVVVEGETGFLVEERHVGEMADRMLTLASSPTLAAHMGERARARIVARFSQKKRLGRLWSAIERSGYRSTTINENVSGRTGPRPRPEPGGGPNLAETTNTW